MQKKEYQNIFILDKALKKKIQKTRPEGMTVCKWNETILLAGFAKIEEEKENAK